MSRRRYRPVYPLRWVHARRGEARAVQHVVAELVGPSDEWDRGRIWKLCGYWLSDGAHWNSDHRGPKTQRPLVTVRPRDGIDMCPVCAKRLAAWAPPARNLSP